MSIMPDTLIKLAGRHAPQALRLALGAVLSPAQLRTLDVLHADQAELTYVYLVLDPAADAQAGREPAHADPAARRDALQRACVALCPQPELVGLECTLDLAGHSSGSHAEWHYVVETDVRPEAEDDFNAWYCTEHMPGLAAVPGTARARRYVGTAAPRHYATYDLAAREAFGSEPWLAVRATAWSSRVRPNFYNTRRTMFRRVEDPAQR